MVFGSIPLFAWHIIDTSTSFLPRWGLFEWGLMAYASLLGSALAYGLFFWFANREEITSFSTLAFLTPVFALGTGGLWLGERLEPLQWVGVVLVLGGILGFYLCPRVFQMCNQPATTLVEYHVLIEFCSIY